MPLKLYKRLRIAIKLYIRLTAIRGGQMQFKKAKFLEFGLKKATVVILCGQEKN